MDFTILAAIGMVIVGISLVIPAWSIRKKSQRFDLWTAERGKVVSVAVREQPPSPPPGTSYVDVVVQYEYRSAGQLRFGSSIVGTFLKTEEEAVGRLTEQYAPDNDVDIFCDPEDSHHTILKIPRFAWRLSLFAGIALFSAGAVVLLLRLWRG
jgi:hypothetical protein